MQRWGQTTAGKVRYRCLRCRVSSTWKRPDIGKQYFRLFLRYLIKTTSLNELAHYHHLTRRTLIRQFSPYWLVAPLPIVIPIRGTLVLDATYLAGRREAVLVARTPQAVICWGFALHENQAAWELLLSQIRGTPRAIVCDGQKGLLKAVGARYPQTPIQRCLKHVKQGVQNKLSTHPKTAAGKELYQMSKQITNVRTRRQKRRWVRQFKRWIKRYAPFLNERSQGIMSSGRKHSWYTHGRLRGAKSILLRALPHLFTFVGHYEIPRTSNHIEGGINARLKELLRNHRGMPLWKKQILCAYFLRTKQRRKPTRNVT